jgi:hypothetical protein
MTQVDSSRMFNASSDAVWQLVADPARLAEWVPTTRLAQRADAEDVHLEGESHGHPMRSPVRSTPTPHSAAWIGAPSACGAMQAHCRLLTVTGRSKCKSTSRSPTTSSHRRTRSSLRSGAGRKRR